MAGLPGHYIVQSPVYLLLGQQMMQASALQSSWEQSTGLVFELEFGMASELVFLRCAWAHWKLFAAKFAPVSVGLAGH